MGEVKAERINRKLRNYDRLVDALKRAKRLLLNVYHEHSRDFVSGRYDDPGDDKQEQVEADLFLDEIDGALKAAGEES